MKFYKIFSGTCIFFCFFGLSFSFEDEIQIISRSEWGAEESYRYKDGKEWKQIIESWKNTPPSELTEAQKLAQKKAKEKTEAIDNYLVKNYLEDVKIVSKQSSEGTHTLVWPIEKTAYVKGIIIHHTETEYTDSYEGIRSIYRYHALSRMWGDIGYNYVIGYDGEIFEGRAGGDYVVGAQALYNNRSTIGISLMGNMQNHDITEKQLLALEKLILFVSKKYGIDLTQDIDFHKECKGTNCINPLISFKSSPLVGHQDVGSTSCPGEFLYQRLDDFRTYLAPKTKAYSLVKNSKSQITDQIIDTKIDIKKMNSQDLINNLAKIEYALDATTSQTESKKLSQLKKNLLFAYKSKKNTIKSFSGASFEDTYMIKVRLSYPHTGSIDLTNGVQRKHIEFSGTGLLVDNVFMTGYTMNSIKKGYITISSWERIPAWDTEKKYNDNTFRGKIRVYVKENALVVVNEVLLSDYLKGLGEISNNEDTEKARTIIIAARSYARHYMGKIRKYPGKYYDASDNPDEFQKYLGYGLESRSPKLNRIVQDTKSMYITYKGNIIKPWYFSSSNGKTLSFYEYCIQGNGDEKKCREESKKYPYLQSVVDMAGIGRTQYGHGVGIPGTGVSYFAQKGWTAEMIAEYFMKGTYITYK